MAMSYFKSAAVAACLLGMLTAYGDQTGQGQSINHLQAKFVQQAQNNLQSSQAFLAQNKKRAGVSVLKSGLQYKVITKGTGKLPKSTDTVTVDYEGSLVNGSVFDSSYKRKQPATFPVNGVIKGWQEALQLMPVGSTWMLYIPPELAYGKYGVPGSIGPNEVLIFKVHLISIQH